MSALNLHVPAEVLTEEAKQSIITAAKNKYKDSLQNRRSEAAVVIGVILDGGSPNSFPGWASGTTGHWGIVVDNRLHHLIFKKAEGKIAGIEFQTEYFRQILIDEGRVTSKEKIGSTSLPFEALRAVGEALILQFGDYRRLYRNCQTFVYKLSATWNAKLALHLLSRMLPHCLPRYYHRGDNYSIETEKIHWKCHQRNKKGNFLGRDCRC